MLDARNAWTQNNNQLRVKQQQIAEAEVLKAPRAGTVMGSPKPDDLLRMWDKADGQPVCIIGDMDKLRILVGVGAIDYREMRINLDRARVENPADPHLEVSILPSRRSDHQFKGRITKLPDTDEKNLPIQLVTSALFCGSLIARTPRITARKNLSTSAGSRRSLFCDALMPPQGKR